MSQDSKTQSAKRLNADLIIGIVSSVFCALVLTRWVFDALVEFKVIDDLKMLLLFRRPAIDFIRMRRPAMIASGICIVIGLGMVGYRGERNLGHEFTGGILAQIALSEPLTVEEARGKAATMTGFEGVAARRVALR